MFLSKNIFLMFKTYIVPLGGATEYQGSTVWIKLCLLCFCWASIGSVLFSRSLGCFHDNSILALEQLRYIISYVLLCVLFHKKHAKQIFGNTTFQLFCNFHDHMVKMKFTNMMTDFLMLMNLWKRLLSRDISK